MLSKTVIDSMRDDFNEKFGRLSERSLYLKEAIAEIRGHIDGFKDITEDQKNTFSDDLYAVISSASILGYYIGLQEGASIIQVLSSADLPEKMLDAFGELNHYGGQPL